MILPEGQRVFTQMLSTLPLAKNSIENYRFSIKFMGVYWFLKNIL